MADPIVQARDLSYRIGAAVLVESVTFDAHVGEVLSVVGPNGAGKSTLLRLLAGELRPSGGDALIDGRAVSSYSAGELALKRAVLPQQTVLQFSFTARDVVLMGRSPHIQNGWASAEDGVIAERYMSATDTLAFAARSYPTLSGGEQSRVTIARVLAQEAPVLLLDEPTSSLDVRHQEAVMRLAQSQARQGRCVVAVVHDLNLAAAYSDRIAIMQEGRIAAHGAPAVVLRNDLLSSVFECGLQVIRNAELSHPLVVPRRNGKVVA